MNAREHAEQNPGHLIVSTVGQPTFCGHGDYRDPLLDLTAVKLAGAEVQTDEEWARRNRTAELAAPRLERERAAMAEVIDGMIAKAGTKRTPPWTVQTSTVSAGDITKALNQAEVPSPQAQDISRHIQDNVSAIAHRRAEQVNAHLERNWEAIERLRARGIEVWLEEGPMEFSSDHGDKWSVRATSTVRIRFAGDGVGE